MAGRQPACPARRHRHAILDDVAVMTKVAAKKTAGVLGDDLALNASRSPACAPSANCRWSGRWPSRLAEEQADPGAGGAGDQLRGAGW
jgi:hypothetical protein